MPARLRSAWSIWLFLIVMFGIVRCSVSYSQQQKTVQKPATPPSAFGKETLHYGVEWRLIRAGTAKIDWTPSTNSFQGDLHLESAGLVSKLYRVNDSYTAQVDDQLCATSIYMKSLEGKRERETKVTFDHQKRRATYLERDLIKNTTVLAKDTDTPGCFSDILGGLYKMRTLNLELGQSANIPISDGKKAVYVRLDAQEREEVKTITGTHKTIRYEVFVFNNVLYSKQGRAFVWLTDDSRKTPVQIRVRMQFLIGTITLQLEKEERN